MQAALDDIIARRKRTTVTIAHRLTTIRNADKIVVLKKGAVVETGCHDALRERGGLYAELLACTSRERAEAGPYAELCHTQG